MICLAGLLTVGACAPARAAGSHGTTEQIAWVRRAAHNFLTAEIGGDGGSACGVLAAPLRASTRAGSCESRWDARLRGMLHDPHVRASLHADLHVVAGAAVQVHGGSASIALPAPLLNGRSRFEWSENCWMLRG
ncbi:MAG TPA: hypothetical protein VKG38_09590 [Solirubrobacteraceae bacterium]|nr:hypothetical protein [Solirubrobacteraceae bacterium]